MHPLLRTVGTVAMAAALTGLAPSGANAQSAAAKKKVFIDQDGAALGTDIKLYAYQLFTTYLLPVQVMGFLLLIAMLGVIVLSKRWAGSDDVK